MDRVTEPTNYEPPRVRTYPQGTQDWVGVHYITLIVPRRCVSFGGGCPSIHFLSASLMPARPPSRIWLSVGTPGCLVLLMYSRHRSKNSANGYATHSFWGCPDTSS